MSGHQGTLEKVRSKVGQEFLAIIGKNSSAMGDKKEKKAAKERLKGAMKGLSPWYDEGGFLKSGKVKTVGALGWLEDEHELFATGIEAVETARKGNDFKQAADLAEKAKQYAQSLDKAKTDRTSAENEIAAVRKVLSKIAEPTSLRAEISTKLGLEAEALRRGDPPEASLRRVRDLKDQAETLASNGRVGPKRSPVEQKRSELMASIRQAVDTEDVKIRKLAQSVLPSTPGILPEMDASALFGQRVAVIRDCVSPRKAEADLPSDEARLVFLQKNHDEAMAKLPGIVKTFAGELTKNKGADFVRTLQSDAGKQTKQQALAAARDQFLQDYAEVETVLAGLADILSPTPPDLATAVQAAKQKILDKDQYDKSSTVIATMLKHLEGARQAATEAAAGAAGTLSTELATLRGEVSKQSKSVHKRTRLAFTALSTELDQLEVIVKTNNVAAFGAADERVAAIRAAGITAAPAITRFNETVDAIEAITSDKVVAKEFNSENNDIALAVKTVVNTLSLFDLAAAQKTMDGLKRDAEKLKASADALGPWRSDMKARLKTLAAMIKAFHKLVPDAADATFELNYNQALEQYDQVGVDRAAVTKLVNEATALVYPIINNLQQAGTGQARTINVLEADRKVGQARIAEEEGKKRAEQEKHDALKAGLDKYHADLKVAEAAVEKAVNGDKEALSELKILGDQARKKFKAGDEEGAASQLKSIRKSLDALLKTPGGVTAESVAMLADADGLWATAMSETRTLLDQIADRASPAIAAARLRPEEVRKQISDVYDLLQPFRPTLVRSMKVVGDATTDLKTRKSEREYALRDVRAMRAIIDGNALAAKLTANPFGVAAPFAKVRRFLADMEFNALRAVPPD